MALGEAMVLVRKILAIVLFTIGAPLPAQTVDGGTSNQLVPEPPNITMPGERVAAFAGGCAMVFDASEMTSQKVSEAIANNAKYQWKGECIDDLANGIGEFVPTNSSVGRPTKFELFLGRAPIFVKKLFYLDLTAEELSAFKMSGQISSGEAYAIPAGEGTLARSLSSPTYMFDAVDTMAPVLYDSLSYDDGTVSYYIEVKGSPCSSLKYDNFQKTFDGWNLDSASQKLTKEKCREGANAYYLQFSTKPSSAGLTAPFSTNKFYLCSGVTVSGGCQTQWQDTIRPLLPAMKGLVAEARDLQALWENRIVEFHQNYRTQSAAYVTAKKEFEIASQAEADAKYEADKAAFAKQVAAAPNAGALYAIADEMIEAGDYARARIALRALLKRFSESPLAAKAADLLGTLPSSGEVG